MNVSFSFKVFNSIFMIMLISLWWAVYKPTPQFVDNGFFFPSPLGYPGYSLISWKRCPKSKCDLSVKSLAGLVINWVVLPHGFKDVIWNLLYGSLMTWTKRGKQLQYRPHELELEQVGLSLVCKWFSVTYLCHLHGYTFRKVPLDVFKVYLCCGTCYMRQLQNIETKYYCKDTLLWNI